jgi:hypothetical protein
VSISSSYLSEILGDNRLDRSTPEGSLANGKRQLRREGTNVTGQCTELPESGLRGSPSIKTTPFIDGGKILLFPAMPSSGVGKAGAKSSGDRKFVDRKKEFFGRTNSLGNDTIFV